MATAGEVKFSTTYFQKIHSIMAKHPEICCIIAALLFSLCTKYSQSHERVLLAPQPHPRRFFPSTSPVLDFPYGNLGPVAELLRQEEVIFVMYYAPWCAQSMRVRVEYEKAATYLQDKVSFVGVNCWYTHGQCREQNSFTSYPVLMVYHTTLDGHRYTGVLEADYMVAFLQKFLLPLAYLRNKEEVGHFIARRDNVVIGYFDFHASPQPPGYSQFYYAAMRVLEREPRNPVDFGVITSPILAAEFSLVGDQHILVTQPFNETLRYNQSANFTSSAISSWVLNSVDESKKSLKWMLQSGTKSRTLAMEIQKSPSLIVFVPHSPLYPTNHHYAIVRELALSYHNCANTTKIHNTLQSSIYLRWAATLAHVEFLDKCRELRDQEKTRESPRKNPLTNILTCCSSVVPFGTPTATNSCTVCMHYSPIHPLSRQHCPLRIFPDLPWDTLLPSLSSCLELRTTYNPSEHITMCCEDNGSKQKPVFEKTSALHQVSTDPFIDNAEERGIFERCRELRLQRSYGWLPVISVPGLANLGAGDDFVGLGCGTNRSINFLVMNSRLSWMFAEKLGFETQPSETSVIYIDEEREAQYVMEEEFNKENLLSFIKNISHGSQPRSLRSYLPENTDCDDVEHTNQCVLELSTLTFDDVIMDPEKDVVVYYYAPWCGFCAAFSHVFLTLARYFQSSPNIVFTRIDASENDLPWEFTVDAYPTIHFFPANRKEDSVSFPPHLRKTLPNLIQFVLRFATPSLRLTTGLSICSRTCIRNNQQTTASRIQELHAQTHLLHRRALLIQQRLDNLRHTYLSRHSNDVTSTYKTSIRMLQEYVYLLRRSIRRRQLEYRSARYLHSVLMASQGVFIDKHKLSGILRNHQHLKVALGDLEHLNVPDNDNSDVISDVDEGSDENDVGGDVLIGIHDEL